MFSHMIVGSNDIEASKKFLRRRSARSDGPAGPGRKGRAGLRRNGGVFVVTNADRRRAGTPRQRRHHRLRGRRRRSRSMPGTTRASRPAARRSRTRRACAERRSARCTSPICAIPTATRSCALHRPALNDARNRQRSRAVHGGAQGVYRHASADDRHADMTFSVFVPAAGERASRCRCCGICRA